MNIDRRVNGKVDENEPHKFQTYITTAGYKNTFAYNKLIQLLVWMIVKDDVSFVFGGDWKIPVMHELLNEDFVEELKEDGTYSESSFQREYESIWSGSTDSSFFDGDLIERHRTLENAEWDGKIDSKRESFYIVSADVARRPGSQNADTVAMIMKAIPRKNGTYTKHVVNMFVLSGEHFEHQSIKLKQLVFRYNARMLMVDGNGLGVGLLDYLVRENVDDSSGDILPPFSVTNDDSYDQYRTKDSLPLVYMIQANNSNSSQIHVNCLSQISSGKVKFLIDEMTAKAKLIATPKGKELQDKNSDEFALLLRPYVMTSILKEEMLNLQRKQDGKMLTLDRVNKRIQKDRFSALEYALWYLKTLEDVNLRNKESVDEMVFLFKKPNQKTQQKLGKYGR